MPVIKWILFLLLPKVLQLQKGAYQNIKLHLTYPTFKLQSTRAPGCRGGAGCSFGFPLHLGHALQSLGVVAGDGHQAVSELHSHSGPSLLFPPLLGAGGSTYQMFLKSLFYDVKGLL